jgi:hypothetical protein
MFRAARLVVPVRRSQIAHFEVPRHTVWRFYMTKDCLWKWQRVTVNRNVVAESPEGYRDLDSCVASAKDGGYVYKQPQAKAVSRTH